MTRLCFLSIFINIRQYNSIQISKDCLAEQSFNRMKYSTYSNLYETVDKYVLYPNAKTADFQTQIFKEPLFLTVIDCTNIMYASDLNHSIQLSLFYKNVQKPEEISIKTNPFNRVASNFYRKLDQKKFNIWEVYNCNIPQLLMQQPVYQPSPYSPQFYFGGTFNQFKKMKNQNFEDVKLPVTLNNRTIRIWEWKILIVNISDSGWYAPVLQALSFAIQRKNYQENFKNVNLILYQSKVKKTMETMWQTDLKQTKFNKMPQRYGCYYFTMLEKQNTFPGANMYQLDKEKRRLNYNKDKKHFYIPIGRKLQDILILNEQIGQNYEINQKQVKDKYIEVNYKELFSSKNDTNVVIRQNREGRDDLWSSDEDSQQLQQNNEDKRQQMVDQNDEEVQESEDEDPLKNTYIKYLKQQGNKIF